MDKQTAENLWNAIIGYADALSGVAGEGNSGEFSDEAAEQELMADLEAATHQLSDTFTSTTGWQPVFKEGTQETGWCDQWFLIPEGYRLNDKHGARPEFSEWQGLALELADSGVGLSAAAKDMTKKQRQECENLVAAGLLRKDAEGTYKAAK